MQPSLDSVSTINEDGSRNFVHPADVRGRFTTLRKVAAVLLIAVYVLLPWIPINGNPAVFLDVRTQQFHLFGLTFVAQDLWLAFFLITGLGFALFYLTAVIGRVWCGWACPQTVFLDHVFRRIERWLEGNSTERRKLDRAPWTAHKIARRGTKLVLFAFVSVAIAHIFLSYFVSLPGLYRMMRTSPAENWGVFLFVFILSGILMFNFAWFREQFCIVLCPYGRLQSALIDDDSIIIGYDKVRGEPRGKLHTPGAGDCIDCRRCVQVCPTGIDIRQGLQMECIACSNCIDACDEVMTKIDRPRGLIRYDSMNALAGGKTHLIRPRLILYTVLLLLGASVLTVSLSTIRPLEVSALRMPGAPYYRTGGLLRNQYTLRIINKENQPRIFDVTLTADGQDIRWSGFESGVEVKALDEAQRPLVVTLPEEKFRQRFDVEVRVARRDGGPAVTRTVPFIGPGISTP